jgi:hypothetical protein
MPAKPDRIWQLVRDGMQGNGHNPQAGTEVTA